MADFPMKATIDGVHYTAKKGEDADGAPVIIVNDGETDHFYSPGYTVEELKLALSTERYNAQVAKDKLNG